MSTESLSTAAGDRWWLALNGRPEGPRTTAYLVAAVQSGEINTLTPICPEGGCEWRPLGAWPALASLNAHSTVPPPPPPLDRSGSAYSVADFSDRLLTNAALPPAANLLCIYTIVIVPLNWIYNFTTIFTEDNPFREDSVLYLAFALLLIAHLIVSLTLTALLAWGGVQFKELRLSGARLIRLGLGLSLGWGGVLIMVAIGMMILGGISQAFDETGDAKLSGGDIFAYMLEMVMIVADTTGLVWLWRNQARLPLNPGA